jgi:hypothetical protein
MGRDGRKNEYGIGDVHSHLERGNFSDEVKKKVSNNRDEITREFKKSAESRESGGLLGALVKAGIPIGTAIYVANYLLSHHPKR